MKKVFDAVATMKANVDSFAKSKGYGQLFPNNLFENNFFEKLKAKNLYDEFDNMVRKELGAGDTKCYDDGFYVWYEEPCYISDEEIDSAIETAFKHGVAVFGEFMQLRYENSLKYFNDVEVVLSISSGDYHINLWDLAQGDANLFLKGVAVELRNAIKDIIMN